MRWVNVKKGIIFAFTYFVHVIILMQIALPGIIHIWRPPIFGMFWPPSPCSHTEIIWFCSLRPLFEQSPNQCGCYMWMDPNQILTEPSVKELYPHCGRSSSTRDLRTGLNSESKIYYGEDASPGEFPWMVLVQLYHPEASRLCGGSLISVRWIITTAFCVAGAESNITDFQSFARYGHLVMYIHT